MTSIIDGWEDGNYHEDWRPSERSRGWQTQSKPETPTALDTRSQFPVAVAATFAVCLSLAAAQPTAPPPTSEQTRVRLTQAIKLSGDYLKRACDSNGRFAYRINTDSGRLSASYDIVRHAGAIYSLSMLNRLHPDAEAVSTMMRAAKFMQANYIGPDAGSDRLVVWSRPLPTKSDAELGAAGLGSVALAAVDQRRPGHPFSQLQALGRFIIFLQKADGSFYSKYSANGKPVEDWQSLYYPGEAALGLLALYDLDPSPQWLRAAGKALAYLAKSREKATELPPDHWALIATAKFLPYYDRSSCPATRAELVAHATRICDSFLREQITNAADARLIGGFDAGGRTTPTATRLEGMLAALEFLPNDSRGFRTRIETAVGQGIAFLLRAQITSGPYAGGVPGTVLKPESVVFKTNRQASEVRIDYVQHALCAWLRYEALLSRQRGSKAQVH